MALEGEQRVVVIHAAAIVNYADQALAAGFRFNANRARAGVQRIFEQFFYDRSGTLDHFTGSYLVSDIFGQDADAAHGVCPAECGFEAPGSGWLERYSARASSSVFLSSWAMLRRKMRVPNRLAMKTTTISDTPNHMGNDGICTMTRKMKPIVTPMPSKTMNCTRRLSLCMMRTRSHLINASGG